MLESDLRAGLRSLQNSLDKMRSLLAWDQLRQSEMRDTQSIVTAIADPTEGDMRNEYSSFLFTLAQVRNLLRSGAAVLPPRVCEETRLQLGKLYRELRRLNLEQRFWKN